MKKRIFALLLTLAMLLPVLTGCHGAVERNEFAVPEELAFQVSRIKELIDKSQTYGAEAFGMQFEKFDDVVY